MHFLIINHFFYRLSMIGWCIRLNRLFVLLQIKVLLILSLYYLCIFQLKLLESCTISNKYWSFDFYFVEVGLTWLDGDWLYDYFVVRGCLMKSFFYSFIELYTSIETVARDRFLLFNVYLLVLLPSSVYTLSSRNYFINAKYIWLRGFYSFAFLCLKKHIIYTFTSFQFSSYVINYLCQWISFLFKII